MALSSFQSHELVVVSDALDIAEDATTNFYKFSSSQWKRNQYEVKTLNSLKDDEISRHAFALLNKGTRAGDGYESRTKSRDFYFICLQDHQIIKALRRDSELRLLCLLVYILTHELIHIVRFCNFFRRFDVSSEERDSEEKIVHAMTYEILENICIPDLKYVLDLYKNHRICDMVVC